MDGKILFINKFSGKGAKLCVPLVELAISQGYKNENIIVPTSKTKLHPALVKAVKHRPNMLVIAAGDGTITNAYALILKYSPDTKLVVVPLGTANYFYSKIVASNKSPLAAFKGMDKLSPADIYGVLANDRMFTLVCDIGASVAAFELATGQQKRRFGKWAYIVNFAKATSTAKKMHLNINTGDGQSFDGNAHQVVVVNQSFNSRIKYMPNTSAKNQSFDIVVYTAINHKLSVYVNLLLYTLSLGRITRGITIIRATSATIKSKNTHKYGLDGDSVGVTPINISVSRAPVSVLVNSAG